MIVHLPVIIARIVINIYSIFSCFRGESVIRQRGQVTVSCGWIIVLFMCCQQMDNLQK